MSDALEFFLQTARKFEIVFIVLAKTVCRNPVIPSVQMVLVSGSVSGAVTVERMKQSPSPMRKWERKRVRNE